MAELPKTVKGQLLISVGDHPEMRKAFKGLKMEEFETRYTVGGGGKKTVELLIKNW